MIKNYFKNHFIQKIFKLSKIKYQRVLQKNQKNNKKASIKICKNKARKKNKLIDNNRVTLQKQIL